MQVVPSIVQSLSCVQLFATSWTAARQAPLSFTISGVCSNSCSLSWWYHPVISSSVAPFSFCLQSFPASSSFLALCIRWPKYWSFSISPSSECSGLISFRILWFGLLAAQGTLKSLLQHHNSSISSLALSLFYGPTLTSVHDYWKNHGGGDLVAKCVQLLQPHGLCSLPGSSVHGILQARTLEWVAISFSRVFPNPGIKPGSLALQADSLLTEPEGKPMAIFRA